MNETFVVVGGGLPGIVAALSIARLGLPCSLIEASPNIGGLLRSYDVNGNIFDFGSHFANLTGIKELDEMLYGGHASEWKEYSVLSAGNFWNGKLNEGSDNPDLNYLDKDLHHQCLVELLTASGWNGLDEPKHAEEFLISEYGRSLVEIFFDPVLMKFTGKRSSELHHKANLLFNLKRFSALDSIATIELKKSPKFDSRFSFHHRNDFNFHKPCLYPRNGGIGSWINQLEIKLRSEGVDVRVNSRIEKIEIANNKVVTLFVDGETIESRSLFWSAPPVSFCNLAGFSVNSPPPEFRSTILIGLVIDRKFQTDCHYVTVFDTNFFTFRITFYDNFREQKSSFYTATVEFMVSPQEVNNRDWARVAVDELTQMGLLSNESILINHHKTVVSSGFPVQSNESLSRLSEQLHVLKKFDNVYPIGRANGEGWFLDNLIRDAHEIATKVGTLDSR